MTEVLSALPVQVSRDGATTAAALRIADQRTAAALQRAIEARVPRLAPLPTAPVGPFLVADARREEVVDRLVRAFQERKACVAFALHVGGLLHLRDDRYRVAMQRADLVYADGVSIVKLARQAGAEVIERAATTDIGPELLRRVSDTSDRPPRVALIGGPPGLAGRAAQALQEEYAIEVVGVEHGFHDEWGVPLSQLLAHDPDIVIVGLGAPREMRWVEEHRAALGNRVVLTCGGWFGFVTGDESRAPAWVQTFCCEWLWRWAQQPQRLARRYVLGALVCGRLSLGLRVSQLRARLVRRRPATP